jgi:hypothetical protein
LGGDERADHVLILTRSIICLCDLIVIIWPGGEPSWLGNQLMVLYLPLLAAGAFTRQSAFSFRRGWLSVETGMLVWAALILALTRSRISQISFLALVSIGLVWLGWRVLSLLERRLGLARWASGAARRLAIGVLNAMVLGGQAGLLGAAPLPLAPTSVGPGLPRRSFSRDSPLLP